MSLSNREKFVGEKIPTLEEAVEECVRLQLTIYFDVKGHPDEVQPAKQTNKQSRTRLCSNILLYFGMYLIWLFGSSGLFKHTHTHRRHWFAHLIEVSCGPGNSTQWEHMTWMFLPVKNTEVKNALKCFYFRKVFVEFNSLHCRVKP